jgi:hypothetical protein
MFGLEKEDKGIFQFELEKELRKNPSKVKELLKNTDGHIQEIKNLLRQGTGSEHFDKLGVLLNGYSALQKVLTKVANKK